MKRIDELFSASIRWMFSSPGIPKTYLTPSFSRHFTISLATVGFSLDVTFSTTFFFMPATYLSDTMIKRRQCDFDLINCAAQPS
jgi:hypothetical protein